MTRHALDSYDSIRSWQEDLYRDLHRHPELSFHEERTRGVIAENLTSFGYRTQEIGGGVVGILGNDAGGPVALLRADIDGLPIKEATGLPFASTDTTLVDGVETPIMHACGHDVHIATALGAASLMASNRDEWRGTAIFLFQPAEEVAGGARAMLDAGLAEAIPTPDIAFAQHVLALEAGKVGIVDGPFLSTATSMRITLHGTGSHGSMPQLSVDPVVLAAQCVVHLQTVVSRELAPSEFGVLTVGSIHSGTSANIIPDTATLDLNLRAYDSDVLDRMIGAIKRIVDGECAAAGTPAPADYKLYNQYPRTSNDPASAARLREVFTDELGADILITDMPTQSASEDFSHIPNAFGIPYVYWALGGFAPGREPIANHNPAFAPDMQPTLEIGTKAGAAALLGYLK